jgi:hypothetical protein
MRRIVLSLIVAGLMLALLAAPALAINHAQIPAEACSDSPSAGGRPAASTGLAQTPKVGPPASDDNPGVSEGALGEERSSAEDNCAATQED